ncbi:MAG: hypothetical protein WAV38_28755 [Xanthobacteraceae bacterium]
MQNSDRVVRDGALSCRFVADEHLRLEPGDQRLLTLFRLDLIAQKHTNPETVALAQWMGDLLFMVMIPESLILKEAGGRDTIWHRRLRKKQIASFKQYYMRLQELDDDQHQEKLRQKWNDCWAAGQDRRRSSAGVVASQPAVTSAPVSLDWFARLDRDYRTAFFETDYFPRKNQ